LGKGFNKAKLNTFLQKHGLIDFSGTFIYHPPSTISHSGFYKLLIILTNRPQATFSALGLSGHTNIASMKDQPVMGFMNEIYGNEAG